MSLLSWIVPRSDEGDSSSDSSQFASPIGARNVLGESGDTDTDARPRPPPRPAPAPAPPPPANQPSSERDEEPESSPVNDSFKDSTLTSHATEVAEKETDFYETYERSAAEQTIVDQQQQDTMAENQKNAGAESIFKQTHNTGDINDEVQEPDPVESPDAKEAFPYLPPTPADSGIPRKDETLTVRTPTQSENIDNFDSIVDRLIVETVDPDAETFDMPGESSSTALVALRDENTALMTPSPTKRFHLLSDEKSIPSQLNRLQEQALRRRHEFGTRVHNLECQLAKLTAQLANETMDRESLNKNLMERAAYKPLDEMMDRISLERDAHARPADDADGSWLSFERRICRLDSRMTHSVYVSVQDSKREKLESLQEQLDGVSSDLQLEISKADKREGGMVRRFESLAGTIARRFQEERAARIAETVTIEAKLRELQNLDQKRADEFLTTIQQLRSQLSEERAKREEQDVLIKRSIQREVNKLKILLLEITN